MADLMFGYALSCFDAVNGNPERSAEEKFRLIKESGADGYQFDLPGQVEPDDLAALGQEFDLRCLALNDYRQDLDDFERNLAVAQRLGARVYNHHLPKALADDLSGACKVVGELRKRCDDCGILYCVELHRFTFTHELENAYLLKVRIPDIAFLADFSHYVIQGYGYAQLQGLYDNVRAMHLRVANSECSQPELYEGKTLGLQAFETMFKDVANRGNLEVVISEMIPYYLQYPPYDLHRSNCEAIRLARQWSKNGQ